VTAALRPATADDAAILALHHHHALRASGSSDEDATQETGVVLPWLRAELLAGRLIAVVAGDGVSAVGSAALHHAARPSAFDDATLLFVHVEQPDPPLERALVSALLSEARLRGIARINAAPESLEGLGLEALPVRAWRL
jgi:hypothetical protein